MDRDNSDEIVPVEELVSISGDGEAHADDASSRESADSDIPAADSSTDLKSPPKEISSESEADDEAKPQDGLPKLPRPTPHEGSTLAKSEDEAVSSDTISIRRSSIINQPSPKDIIDTAKEKAKESELKKLKISCYKCSQKLDLSELEPFSKIECPSCKAELIVPKWFDNYLLEEPGGEGGMATVFRALDLTLDREVAIKVLSPDVASHTERTKLFLHEARTTATLNHYAIIPIYTCGEYLGQPYIVMQYMDGGSLDKRLEQANGRLSLEDVAKWISDAAEGLDSARRHGIIHHDVKPANIMLDKDGNAKVGDFGIAQALRDFRSKELDEITKLWSSPHFVSPEKISTGKEDFHGDVYSLGASFYNIATGKTPFEIEEIDALIKFKLDNDPSDPRRHRPEIPEEMSHLIMAMMSRTPEFRPGYRDIINQLSAFMKKKSQEPEQKPSQDKKKSEKKKSQKIPQPKSLSKTSAPSPAPFEHKKSSAGTVFFILAICVIIGGVLFFMKQNGLLPVFSESAASYSGPLTDQIPHVTEMFRNGSCKSALTGAGNVLSDTSMSAETRAQAAVQFAFATYLCNDPGAKNICSVTADQMRAAGIRDSNPLFSIVNFLASSAIPSESLDARLGDNPQLKQLGAMAVYLRAIHDKAGEMAVLKAFKNLSSLTNINDSTFWGNAWKSRLRAWQDWINYGSGSQDGLEPLILANKYESKVVAVPQEGTQKITVRPKKQESFESPLDLGKLNEIDVSELSVEWLKKNRVFAEKRPRPGDYSFSDKVISDYLSSLTPELAGIERNRLIQVASIKSNLCSWMMRTPYQGTNILLKNGTKLTGAVMANNKFVSVRMKSGEHKRLAWSDLDFKEVVKILKFYTDMRLNAYGGPVVDSSQQKTESAMDYMRIGMLCDWYGFYPEAVEYSKKALDTDSKVSSEIKKYIMY